MDFIRNLVYTAVVLFLGIIVGAMYGALAAFIPGITIEMMASDAGYAITTTAGAITVVCLHKQMK